MSCDQSEENYKQLVRLGPWWAVPYLDFKRRAHLSYLFEVCRGCCVCVEFALCTHS